MSLLALRKSRTRDAVRVRSTSPARDSRRERQGAWLSCWCVHCMERKPTVNELLISSRVRVAPGRVVGQAHSSSSEGGGLDGLRSERLRAGSLPESGLSSSRLRTRSRTSVGFCSARLDPRYLERGGAGGTRLPVFSSLIPEAPRGDDDAPDRPLAPVRRFVSSPALLSLRSASRSSARSTEA
jgi:hypothetical protein